MSDDAYNFVGSPESVVEEPIIVDDASQLDWERSTDLLVVGFGAAGACAALEAREQGLDVIILERFDGGGATRHSGGIVYAGDTEHIKQAGYEDSPDGMFDYLSMECQGVVSDTTLRDFCRNSRSNLEWLEKHGVGFEGSVHTEKATFPPEDKYLYFSGNEKVPAYAEHAQPVPRGHRVKGKGWTGYVLFDALQKAVESKHATVERFSKVVRLVVDKKGAVLGVEVNQVRETGARNSIKKLNDKVDPQRPFNFNRAEQAIESVTRLEETAGERSLIRALDGVVLSTGGFNYNRKMLDRILPKIGERVEGLMRLGSAGCSGSGIQLGSTVGAALDKMSHTFVGRMISPPNALVEGIIVNLQGARFINEDTYNADLGSAILDQKEGKAWIILDQALRWKLLKQCIPSGDGTFRYYLAPTILSWLFGGTKKGQTIRELASKIGVDPDGLENTVAKTRGGGEDALGKGSDYVRPIGEGPYWALDTSVGNTYAFCTFFTLGGLVVDEQSGAVLRKDGTAIDGLFAAGRCAMGLPSNGYISGLSLADCVYSGRRAAKSASGRKLQN